MLTRTTKRETLRKTILKHLDRLNLGDESLISSLRTPEKTYAFRNILMRN